METDARDGPPGATGCILVRSRESKMAIPAHTQVNLSKRCWRAMNKPPKISVVVPSFNQARYLELALQSIFDQGYPDLEIIVIDGGSNDGSADIIRRHEQHMKFWCSEPDGGQTQGIIKGFSHATGEILCFLNSDDLFEPGVLLEVGEYFARHLDVDAVYGD